MTVNVIKWKSDSVVSITHAVCKLRGKLVSIKSMHLECDRLL